MKNAPCLNDSFLRFVRIVGDSTECQKIDKMRVVPEGGLFSPNKEKGMCLTGLTSRLII
jgi:hypothetical protein